MNDAKELKKLGINIEDAEFSDKTAPIEKQLGRLKENEESFLDLKPFTDRSKQDNGRYRFDTKVEAIMHMQVDMDINDDSLDLCPNYSRVAELMDINWLTLKRWWAQKEEIIKRAQLLIDQMSSVAILKNSIEILRIQNSLETRKYEDENLKDLMVAMKTLTVQNRILATGADNVTEVRHTHQIQLVEPNRVEAGK